jgi:hypothetical protein
MLTQVKMNDKQAALINTAHGLAASAKRDLDLLLEGIASGLDGKLVNADTDKKLFNLEVPDETTAGEAQ